jgi:predicted RNA polymerase sigma factor
VAGPRRCRDQTRGDAIDTTRAAVTAVYREEAGRLTGHLVHVLGDFELAEELVQEAVVAALERWPIEGIPARPRAWLYTVAQRRALGGPAGSLSVPLQ